MFNLPPPAPASVPGFAKDGGKNFKMKDSKEKNVMPVSTAEYKPCGWGAWLNNTTISLGMQNVFDEDPPFAAGSGGYDASLATIKGRFWYVQLKKNSKQAGTLSRRRIARITRIQKGRGSGGCQTRCVESSIQL